MLFWCYFVVILLSFSLLFSTIGPAPNKNAGQIKREVRAHVCVFTYSQHISVLAMSGRRGAQPCSAVRTKRCTAPLSQHKRSIALSEQRCAAPRSKTAVDAQHLQINAWSCAVPRLGLTGYIARLDSGEGQKELIC
jgi:hypothetical protein